MRFSYSRVGLMFCADSASVLVYAGSPEIYGEFELKLKLLKPAVPTACEGISSDMLGSQVGARSRKSDPKISSDAS